MSKLKKLKDYIKTNTELFNRIIGDYKLYNGISFIYNYLEYKSNKGKMKIDLTGTNRVKVLKQEQNKKILELITIENNEVISKEKIRENNTKEDINRIYINNKLVSLDAKITLNASTSDETIIKIHIEKDLIIINDRDVSLLYKNSKLSIEEIYKLLKDNYTNTKDTYELKEYPITKLPKSKKQIAIEEEIRQFIKDEYNYEAPLENKNLDELVKILNMLIKRREIDKPKIKEYK